MGGPDTCGVGSSLDNQWCQSGMTQFRFAEVNGAPGKVMIHVVPGGGNNTDNLCVRAGSGYDEVTLEICDENDPTFRFGAGRGDFFNGDKFELVSNNDKCLNQQHHPKTGEQVFNFGCHSSRFFATSYFQKF